MWLREIKHFSTWSLCLVQTNHLEYLKIVNSFPVSLTNCGDGETWKRRRKNNVQFVAFSDSIKIDPHLWS